VPGQRHHHLVGAITVLVTLGYSDEVILATLTAPFMARFTAEEARQRRPQPELLKVLAWARSCIGPPPPDIELPRPRWAR
jgi:hypothetical protein